MVIGCSISGRAQVREEELEEAGHDDDQASGARSQLPKPLKAQHKVASLPTAYVKEGRHPSVTLSQLALALRQMPESARERRNRPQCGYLRYAI